MAHVRIEMDRGKGWEVRQEGDMNLTAEELIRLLPDYCIQYSHRVFLDGKLIATGERPYGRRGKTRIVVA